MYDPLGPADLGLIGHELLHLQDEKYIGPKDFAAAYFSEFFDNWIHIKQNPFPRHSPARNPYVIYTVPLHEALGKVSFERRANEMRQRIFDFFRMNWQGSLTTVLLDALCLCCSLPSQQ